MTKNESILSPFLIIPGISPQVPQELKDALAELNEAGETLEKARAAFHELKNELKAKRAELETTRETISKSGGASAAAARMGLSSGDSDSAKGSAGAKRTVAQLEQEIEDLQSAVDAAPDVFETARPRVEIARNRLRDAYGEFADQITLWAKATREAADAAAKQINELMRYVPLAGPHAYGSGPEGQFANGHPFALIPGLLEFSEAVRKAEKIDYPLVPPAAPPPVMADDRPPIVQRFLEDPKEWRKRRDREEAARDSAEREQRNRASAK